MYSLQNKLVYILIFSIITIILFMLYYYIIEKNITENSIENNYKHINDSIDDIEDTKSIKSNFYKQNEKLKQKISNINKKYDYIDNNNKINKNNIKTLQKNSNINTSNILKDKNRFDNVITEYQKDIDKFIENDNGNLILCDDENHCVNFNVNNNELVVNPLNVHNMTINKNNTDINFVKFDMLKDDIKINDKSIAIKKTVDDANKLNHLIHLHKSLPIDYNHLENKPLLFDGEYKSLKDIPDFYKTFDGKFQSLLNKPSSNDIFDGDYNKLKNIPDHMKRFNGKWSGVTNKPNKFNTNMDNIKNKPEWIGKFDGTFGSLDDVPIVPEYSYKNLTNIPEWMKTFDGSYKSIKQKPNLFDGDYHNLKNKPNNINVFLGTYNSLQGKPSSFPTNFNSIKNKPEWMNTFNGKYSNIQNVPYIFDGQYKNLRSKPQWMNTFDGSYNSLMNSPDIFNGSFNQLKQKPEWMNTFDGSYNSLENLPQLFDGDYEKLQGKPDWMINFDGSYDKLKEIPDVFPSDWNTMINKPYSKPYIIANGINIQPSIYQDYYYIAFTSTTGANSVRFNGLINVEILMVGGGGSGALSVNTPLVNTNLKSVSGGGGGGGAVVHISNFNVSPYTNYIIIVGKGGIANNTNIVNTTGRNGDDSVIKTKDTIIFKASGGGAGTNEKGGDAGQNDITKSLLTTQNGRIYVNSGGKLQVTYTDTFYVKGGNYNLSEQIIAGIGGGGGAGEALIQNSKQNSIEGYWNSATGMKGGDGIRINMFDNEQYWGGGGAGAPGISHIKLMSIGKQLGGKGGGGGAYPEDTQTCDTSSCWYNNRRKKAQDNTGGGGAGLNKGMMNNISQADGGSGIVIFRWKK